MWTPSSRATTSKITRPCADCSTRSSSCRSCRATEDAAALKTIARIRELEDKPEAKLLSGVRTGAVIAARTASGQSAGSAYANAYAKAYGEALAALPWPMIASRIKASKGGVELMGRSTAIANVEADIQPAAASAHEISNDMAAELIDMRFILTVLTPLKAPTLAVLKSLIAANNVTKPGSGPRAR